MQNRSVAVFILITVLLSSALHHLSAQEFSYKHYSVLDGLPQNQVMSLFQDSRGYLWIATKGGVSRFDGHDFLNYSTNDGLLANHVLRIYEDMEGRILFYSYLGLDRLEGDTIVNVFLSDTLLSWRKVYFVERGTHTEWWVREGDRMRIFNGTDKPRFMDLPAELESREIVSIFHEDLYDKTWFVTVDDGFFILSEGIVKWMENSQGKRILKVGRDELMGWDATTASLLDTVSNTVVPVVQLGEGAFTQLHDRHHSV